jgi:(p)ppGpp synthase/HD superfamily hydrolase
MTDLEKKLEEIYNHHDVVCNQKYDNIYPYSLHLKSVLSTAKRFLNNIDKKYWDDVLISAAGHDLIEDGRLPYNDLVKMFNVNIAEIIYCCTDEKGKNRAQRHNHKYYDELKENRLAVFVKLCDVYSNGVYSLLSGSTMFNRYGSDFRILELNLRVKGEYDDLWEELEKLLINIKL